MTKPDLHLHSSSSDGVLSPELLMHEAEQAGVTVMAITDHDTFDGSDQLCRQHTPIPVLPGVELSISDMPGLHLLGYGLAEGTELRAEVARLGEKRVVRAREILARLAELGKPLDWQLLERRFSGTVGRPHIARAMVHAGYVSSMQEAFERYLNDGAPAFVAGERLDMATALQLMRRSGFIPVLAHPCELNKSTVALETLLTRWQDIGLMGVEVYHPSARAMGYELLDRMARRHGLLVTGGSDFHQANDRHGRIGDTAGDWSLAEQDMQALMNALRDAAK